MIVILCSAFFDCGGGGTFFFTLQIYARTIGAWTIQPVFEKSFKSNYYCWYTQDFFSGEKSAAI